MGYSTVIRALCSVKLIIKYKTMKNAKVVAWGINLSLGLSLATSLLGLHEDFYILAGLGFFVFGIWASVVLFKNA